MPAQVSIDTLSPKYGGISGLKPPAELHLVARVPLDWSLVAELIQIGFERDVDG